MHSLSNKKNSVIHNRDSETDENLFERPSLAEIIQSDFRARSDWLDLLCERLFKIRTRGSTIKSEVYFGCVHFISCFYCLAVIPQIMEKAGYDAQSVFLTTAVFSGLGSIICGLFANLPFVCAPVAVVAIFLSVFLRNEYGESEELATKRTSLGSTAVIGSGVLLMAFGWRPLGNFFGRLVPNSIQVGTAIGIGLLVSLAGAIEIELVTPGKYGQLVQLGDITPEVMIAIAGICIICIATHYHVKGSFCIAIFVCSIIFWTYSGEWPKSVVSIPRADQLKTFEGFKESRLAILVADLVFLCLLYLNGLISSLSLLANLTRSDGSVPRGRWIFILCGAMTIAAGWLTGIPVLISPESAAAIKEGAKTGLCAVVCGVLFLLSSFFSPVLSILPDTGTSPILILIGALLFQNCIRVDWKVISQAAPAFIVLFFIPFTYSVIQGVIIGYIVFLIVGLFSGELATNAVYMTKIYCPYLLSFLQVKEYDGLDVELDIEEEDDYMDGISASPNARGSDVATITRARAATLLGMNFVDEETVQRMISPADIQDRDGVRARRLSSNRTISTRVISSDNDTTEKLLGDIAIAEDRDEMHVCCDQPGFVPVRERVESTAENQAQIE